MSTSPSRPRARRALLLIVALTVLALTVAAPAGAHATRIGADPAEDSVLTVSPQRVSATFNEPMQAAFAAMTVVGPDGNIWSEGEPDVTDAVVSVPVRPLGPAGAYTVNYRVTSADGHVVRGSWEFRLAVAGPGASGPAGPGASGPAGPGASGPAGPGASDPDATAPPAAAADPPEEGGLPVWPFVVGGAVLVGAGVWWAVRRRT